LPQGLSIDGFLCAIMGTGKGIENFRNIGCKNGQEIVRAWDPGNKPECKQDLKLGKGIGSYQTGTRCLNFASSFLPFLSSSDGHH
jgi:hypothetical protein